MERPIPEVQRFLALRANEMRKCPTLAEATMATLLDKLGVRYVQQSIKFGHGVYRIFDFYLPKRRVVIEIDGEYHDPERDAAQDAVLCAEFHRYKVVRFPSHRVLNHPDAVIKELAVALGG